MNYRYVSDGVRSVGEKEVPGGAPVGFDLELMQWLPPRGTGKKADLIIRVTGKQVGWKISKEDLAWHLQMKEQSPEEIADWYGIWQNTLVVTFPNPGDGIVRSAKYWPYCKLKIPHRAPDDGYFPELRLEQSPREYGPVTTYDRLELPKNCGFYLRVRTQLNSDGKVVAANYAKILEPEVGHDAFSGVLFYNPTRNDTNLEFGYNLISPPLDSLGKPLEHLDSIGCYYR
jgi:hypothetical protein